MSSKKEEIQSDPTEPQSEAHPSKENWTVFVYEPEACQQIDPAWPMAELQEHLDGCLHCSFSVREIRETKKQLDAINLDSPSTTNAPTPATIRNALEQEPAIQQTVVLKKQSPAPKINSPEKVSPSSDLATGLTLGNATSSIFSIGNWAIAAGLLIATSVSFFLGMQYQAEATRAVISNEIRDSVANLRLEMEQQLQKVSAQADSTPHWKKEELIQWIDKRVASNRLTGQGDSNKMLKKDLEKISGQIQALLTNQNAIKSDIITIAVNTEKEFKIAKNDILRIKQYVNQLYISTP